MTGHGQGYCENDYARGWDGKGIASQDACNAVCLAEADCTYASFNEGATCSRYRGTACHLNGADDHLTFKKLDVGHLEFSIPGPLPSGSPLSNATSLCRQWYRDHGPVKHASNEKAAKHWKNQYKKQTTKRKGDASGVTDEETSDGTGWAVGWKHGCTSIVSWYGAVFDICGCYESWCPIRWHTLNHPDDVYGRSSTCTANAAAASTCDNQMAVRRSCYSAKAVFGCIVNCDWDAGCGYQPDGGYEPGQGTMAGVHKPLWEQMLL